MIEWIGWTALNAGGAALLFQGNWAGAMIWIGGGLLSWNRIGPGRK